MSKVTLLQHKTIQLTKRFTKTPEGYDVEPYPLVSNVTSLECDYINIEVLHQIILTGASNGCCLLKGNLKRQLSDESRRDQCNPRAPTQLLVLDYDRNDGFDSPDHLLQTIDPALADTDYIWQVSSSAGIRRDTKPGSPRGHAFILLSKELDPEVLKSWLIKVNLTTPELRAQIKLSRNNMALVYPLDITVCQNDKLIYIAPPKCVGFDDPIPQADRIRLHKRDDRTYDLQPQFNTQRNREMADELVKELQIKAGLKPRAGKFTYQGTTEVLTNPGHCRITSEREVGPYMRVNLDGGDSWGYWYHIDSPDLLHNFKGEPAVRIEDIDPDYYAQITRAQDVIADEDRDTPLVFRDRDSDQYYNCLVNVKHQRISFINTTGSKDKLVDFLAQYNQPKPKFIEDWNAEFNPQETYRIDVAGKRINLWEPSPYTFAESQVPWVPPTIDLVLRHVTVDDECYMHLLNWIAFIFQKRTRTGTAWLFSGVEGTGKGVLFHKILAPLLGRRYTFMAENKTLEDTHNGFMQNCLLFYLDEADVDTTRSANATMSKLRSYITEERIPIRNMHAKSQLVPNHVNVLASTNRNVALKLNPSDRRWNIAPRQNRSIEPLLRPIFHQLEGELMDFAGFLNNFQVNVAAAQTSLRNKSRQELIERSRTGTEAFFNDLAAGNLEAFELMLTDTPELPATLYYKFENILRTWNASRGQPIAVPCEDLLTVYRYVADKPRMNARQFGWLLKSNEIVVGKKRINGVPTRYVELQFNGEEVHFPVNHPNNVIEFRHA